MAAGDTVHQLGVLIGSSQAAGTRHPQHVLLVDEAGDPVTITGGGSGGGSDVQYTEDAAAASNPIGMAVNLVRSDTPAGQVSADGDNVAQRGTNFGAAYVTLLDAAGAAVSVGGGTQYTEDAAAAANPIGTMLIARRKDTLSGSEVSADGDNIAANATAKGELYVKQTDAVPVTDNGGSLTVDNGGTFAVQATLQASGTIAIGKVRITDGTDDADVLDLTNSNPVAVAIVDGNGDQIVSFGGGTQYTEDAAAAANPVGNAQILVRKDTPAAEVSTDGDNIAQRGTNFGAAYVTVLDAAGAPASFGAGVEYTEGDTDSSITGKALLWEDTSDTLRAVSAAKPLPVSVIAALPAGANAIGKLAANSGVDIGDVDVTSVPADPFGANADAASATGSISAKLRSIAAVGIPITGTVTVGAHAVTNAGTFAVQESGAALTSLQLIDDVVFAEDAASANADKGIQILAKRTDTAAATSGTDGDYEPLQVSGGKLHVSVEPIATGGWDTFMASSSDGATALTNTAQSVKASAGKFGGYYVYNPNASAVYVHIYNVASGSVTVGTTNPKNTFCIPATSAANLEIVNGLAYDTAIVVAATTTGGGNTAPSTALEANFWFK